MTVSQVYQHFRVPPNVQEHMLTTGLVIELLRKNWQGEEVDWQLTLKTMLLHDLGNLIKFKRPFLGELEKDGDYWEQVQTELKSKYGETASSATIAMIEELNLGEVGDQIIKILTEMKKILNSGSGENISIESRLLEYADCVVTPNGIESFEIRMSDLAKRYSRNDKNWDKGFRENAQFIQENVGFDVFGNLKKEAEKIDSTKIFEFTEMKV